MRLVSENLDKKRIVVMISGSGTNLQALIDASQKDELSADIALVMSNNPDAYGLKRAAKAKIDTKIINPSDFENRRIYDKDLIQAIKSHKADLVVLAGYMLICTDVLVETFYGRLINLHPSLLPAFPGVDGIGDALKYGAKATGATVHFVDKGCDTGPIIFQEAVEIANDDDRESLAEKIRNVEHKLLPKAVKYFCEGKLKLKDRKVIIEN